MKTKTVNILLIAIFSFILVSCAQNTKKEKDAKVAQKQTVIELISPEVLKEKLKDDIQLVDVRTPNEYREGYIKGAKLINFFDKDFLEQMSKLDKDKELYIYCRSGNRSGQAAKKVKSLGFTKIYDLKGGIKNWNAKGLETAK